MKKKLHNILPKSEFAKNVLTLMTGTTIAQAIPVAISPILTRIYTPEDFGVLALFIAITSIVGSVANGRYELAIMLPEKDEDAINIFALGFIITCTISLITLFVVILFNDYLVELLDNKEISFFLYFVPISVFFIGLWNILNYFNNRRKQYKDLRNAVVVKSICLAIIQLSVGFFKQGASGLISGNIVSQLFANAKLIKNVVANKLLLASISKEAIIAQAKRYKDFPKFSMWSSVANIMSLHAPVVMLGMLFGSGIAGFYALSQKITSTPISILGGSIGQVFFQEASSIREDKEALKILVKNTYNKLLYLGILPFSIILVFGDILFLFIFGDEWLIAGRYTQYLSMWVFFVFITSPLSTLISILEKQRIGLIFNLIILISRILAIYISFICFKDGDVTIFVFGIVGFLLWFIWCLYLLYAVGISLLKVFFKTFLLLSIVITVLIILRLTF